MKRIRYAKTQEKNVLQSKNVYHHPSNGARYRINIDLNSFTWSVVDDVSGRAAVSGSGTHPHKIKTAVRDALVTLGIPLEVETRERLIKTNLV